MTNIEVGHTYIFKFDGTALTKESREISEKVKNKYFSWPQISGKQVVVTKTEERDVVLVYIKQDGPDFWFRLLDNYLFECTCDLTLLMNRGCQCGFFSMEQNKC